MTQPASDSTTAALQQPYAVARQLLGPGIALAVLHLGDQQCGMAVGNGPQEPVLLHLPLGLDRAAAEHFKTSPPTPLAMENAILVVEDVVMPLRAHIPRDAQLFSGDAAVREIALVCGVPAQPGQPARVLSLESLERGFNRLCNVVAGTPPGLVSALQGIDLCADEPGRRRGPGRSGALLIDLDQWVFNCPWAGQPM